MTDSPQMWVLAGGNGAGKSTFYRKFLAPRQMQFVNADLIAKSLDHERPEAASYDAARIAEHLRKDLLQQGASFCFETVFSHPSKIDFIAEAKALGYQVILVLVHLQNDEVNQARVIQRVSEGGHDVPPEKIVSRIPRTLVNVGKAVALADQVLIFDNSLRSNPYQLVARIEQRHITQLINPLPAWASEVLSDYLPSKR